MKSDDRLTDSTGWPEGTDSGVEVWTVASVFRFAAQRPAREAPARKSSSEG
jgi:hypothetical protein